MWCGGEQAGVVLVSGCPVDSGPANALLVSRLPMSAVMAAEPHSVLCWVHVAQACVGVCPWQVCTWLRCGRGSVVRPVHACFGPLRLAPHCLVSCSFPGSVLAVLGVLGVSWC
jgi:hypothetical protein